ncbi:MAG: division/cell wall cluster transcriptional repressor MraZ [Deltaproteobacteria bacterium]|nr:division/cell wall cluster transcriptional repressor MraZ [Deltaproteobacteria bacterium]
MYFRGHFYLSIDDKGRINLPSIFKKFLESVNQNKVVLTNYLSDGYRCIEGFSLADWEVFESKLRSKSRFNPKIQKLENFYLSRSVECEVDGYGRILIPSYLRSYAGLGKEVTMTSSLWGFRIWDKRIWDLVIEQTEQQLASDPSIFEEADL